MSGVKIHGAEHPVRDIFSNDFAFSIPRYQRPYSWTTDEAGDLLSDLLGALGDDDKTKVADLDPYFLGSIVLVKKDGEPDADVVDGQQRLITLTLLLASLRALADGAAAEALREYLFEKGNQFAGTENRYRVTVRSKDADWFREHVQEDGGIDRLRKLETDALTDSRRNVLMNVRHFLGALTQMPAARRARLGSYVIQRCFVVAVSTPDLDSASRIFEVLNERGLDLTHADILKSNVVGTIAEVRQDAYTQKWEDAEDSLGREAFTELFGHVCMVFAKAKLRESILKEFRKSVLPKTGSSERFIDGVLVPYATAYREILRVGFGSGPAASGANEALVWLRALPNLDWVPPALAYVTRNRGDVVAVGKFLAGLERLAASLLIRRADVNGRIERYASVLTAVEDGADLLAAGSALDLDQTEARETVDSLDGGVYDEFSPKTRVYVLLRLDAALSSGGAVYDRARVTVEHVLPQGPAKGSRWDSEFSEEEQKRWVHRLANLVLLTRKKNSAAQNWEFEQKKTVYFRTSDGVSPFALTTQVLQEAEWNPGVLERRQGELLDMFRALWRLPARVAPSASDVPEVAGGGPATGARELPAPVNAEPDVGDSEDRRMNEVRALARERGVERELLEIMVAAMELGINPSPRKRCVMFTPDTVKTRMLFTLWPKRGGRFEIARDASAVAEFFPQVSADAARAALGPDGVHMMERADVESLVQSLRRLLGGSK